MALQDTLDQINSLDISDIDWSRVGVWPLLAKMFLWLVAVVVILVATYFLFIKDLNKKYEREVAEESTLKQSFQQKAHEAATLEKYKLVMNQMDADFKVLVSQLPEKTEVAELLDDIDEKGRESGLTIGSIKLQPEVVTDIYVELPIEIVVTGSYHDLATFISSVASMSRIVTLHDFDIAQGEGGPAELEMKINAKTYRYRSEEEGGVVQ